ncbi:hypothetical protein J3459_006296 [Metarhizium acridum]|nr:hypothetical protein J3459_006296 [Metarhizium acridum]
MTPELGRRTIAIEWIAHATVFFMRRKQMWYHCLQVARVPSLPAQTPPPQKKKKEKKIEVHINTASFIQNPYPNVTKICGPIPFGLPVGSFIPKYRNLSKQILQGHTGSCKEDI